MSDIIIFNRRHVSQQRRRSLLNIAKHSFLFEWAADQISDRLSDIKKTFSLTVGIGNRAPESFWKRLKAEKTQHLYISDIVQGNVKADSEYLPFADNSVDMAVSILDLHSVNDLPGTLSQIRRILKPDGLFIGCLLGGETLYELRESLMQTEMNMTGGASVRVAPFADTKQIGELLQRAGFALPVVDSEIIRVSYQSLFNLMADLRGMGEANTLSARSKNFTPPGFFARAAEYYQSRFAEDDARITASFEVIFMIGWAPHESQPKPARRGSATHSLTEFLQ